MSSDSVVFAEQCDPHAEQAFKEGDLQGAIRLYLQSIERTPQIAAYRVRLAMLYRENREYEQAESQLQQAIKLRPDNADPYLVLASILLERRETGALYALLTRALDEGIREVRIHYQLAKTLCSMQRLDEAVLQYKHVLEKEPAFLAGYLECSAILLQKCHYQEAINLLLSGVGHCSDNPELHFRLGAAYQFDGIFDAAKISYETALRIDPQHLQATLGLSQLYKLDGDKDRAYELMLPIFERYRHLPAVLTAFSELNLTPEQHQAVRAQMESLLNNNLGLNDRSALGVALGKSYEKSKNYDKAFENYRCANQAKNIAFDLSSVVAMVDMMTQAFSKDVYNNFSRSNNHSETPVFIVGMPRSGTSLVEHILASHPMIYGAGELNDIRFMAAGLARSEHNGYPECMRTMSVENMDKLSGNYLNHLRDIGKDAKRVVDKMPNNFFHLGMISLLFPKARIIHCVRDPMDTCLSCYFHMFSGWHPYAYDLENLGGYYRQYQRMMKHWEQVLTIPIFDVQYEAVVEDQETVTRDLVKFCGLDWDPTCLAYFQNDRPVMTASSEQVRKPIYSSSVGRWKKYSHYLQPLKRALDEQV